MADNDISNIRKGHRKANSGRKAEKKKAKNPHVQDMTAKQRNPKAFAIQSVSKAEKRFRRTMDIQSKRYHVPVIDRTPVKPPPAIVAVVGPPKVGKTTLMQCMIKNFTKQKMTSIKGPVTLVSGKKKRITLIECNNDINNMIDIAKIADLVLLLIDAKSGFEMETFEFLNICQAHGMPRVMGVLTHLDLFKNKKTLQRTKTLLKKRYRTEIPRGEKMFYLSGVLHGEYLKNEVHNLGRFISVMKFFSSSWQKSHPYVFADRIEDITNPELLMKDPNCDRTVCLYGYSRGGALKRNSTFHIPGCGDYCVRNIHFLPDPCPLPEKNKKRSLNEKERLIYAPMCGVGGVVYDKDAVYIELKGSHLFAQNSEENEKPSNQLVSSLISVDKPIDKKIDSGLSIFMNSEPVKDVTSAMPNSASEENDSEEESSNADSDESDDTDMDADSDASSDEEDDNCDEDMNAKSDEDFDEDDNCDESEATPSNKVSECGNPLRQKIRKVRFDIEESSSNEDENLDDENLDVSDEHTKKCQKLDESYEDDTEEIGHLKWKDQLAKKAADAFYKRQRETINLEKIVYGKQNQFDDKMQQENSDNELADGLFHLSKKKMNVRSLDTVDCSKFISEVPRDWTTDEEMDSIRDCFVTGKWAKTEDAEHLLQEDDEMYGDFEDLEASQKQNSDDDDDDEKAEDPITETEDSKEGTNGRTKKKDEKTLQEKRMEKKRKLKEIFNAQFDDKEGRSYYDDLKMEADEQGELNRKEFEHMEDEVRVQYEGYRPGLYLRLEVEQVPCELIKNFDPCYPVVIGSLLNGEDKMGYLQVRMKKHRWYPRILKSHDPLIISLGWRRFQTIPLYYITDHNNRNRLLKYTPKHLHCMASFWGPITAQKSGFCAVQSVSEVVSDFRIAAIGAVMQVDQTTDIVKKLKLVGTPFEIFRKTAFIEGMFHSPLEVAKYEGAAIRTVSGIRGQIKKALRKPPGIFRATFEDKILMSDIVFLRTWIRVEVAQFCVPVCSLLLPSEKKAKWQGMKTLGRLRFEKNLHAPVSEDSLYTPIERKLRRFAPLVVPKNIQKELPFKDKVIHKQKKKQDSEGGRVAVIREPHETEIANVMNMLKTVHQMKTQKEKRAMWTRVRAHKKEKRKNEAIHHKKLQEKKKRIMKFKKVKTNV